MLNKNIQLFSRNYQDKVFSFDNYVTVQVFENLFESYFFYNKFNLKLLQILICYAEFQT